MAGRSNMFAGLSVEDDEPVQQTVKKQQPKEQTKPKEARP
jgi:hypothetical protein